MDFDKATNRLANGVTLWLAWGTVVTGFLGGIFHQILDFSEPWRTVTLLGIVALGIVTLGFLARIARAIYLRRKRRGPNTETDVGPALGGQTGFNILNPQGSSILGNIASFGSPLEAPPPATPRRPTTAAILNRLADQVEALVDDLQRLLDREPLLLKPPWEVQNLSEEERRTYEEALQEWRAEVRRLYDRMVPLYEEARDRGYPHSEMEGYRLGWDAGAQYRNYSAWLSSLARRLRDDAPGRPPNGDQVQDAKSSA